MFGADTPLVMDALQIAALAAALGGGAIYLLVRRGRQAATDDTVSSRPADLEERVQVLERIATDQSLVLADEIEALRTSAKAENAG
ncbi:hypothetical protein [Erythrobacter sp. MTPC3]|uniref:hypothetical protein n=1 Tax=Erythrobacter sp. MTPC3 TaxID=3056564 RepID=UPI0036F22DB5